MAISKPAMAMNQMPSFAMTEERSVRSVFVGNIPYDATEEQLRSIFMQVGNVLSFRMVYDRETGKPKGYGFCEYQDQEMANSAMRNLNNYDINGRQLRVGVAVGDQINEARALLAPPSESPYGEVVEPEKAPEAISKAVASLPPEQMFELMKQMKLCIQNNPNEARHMLLQNPQLAYALLQAQIVMKIVDPQVALAMLYRPVEQIPPILADAANIESALPPATTQMQPQIPVRPERPELSRGVNAPGIRPRGGLLGDMPSSTPNTSFNNEETSMDIGYAPDGRKFTDVKPILGPRPDLVGPNFGPRPDLIGPPNPARTDLFGPRSEVRGGPRPSFRPGPRPEMDLRPGGMRGDAMGMREGRFPGPSHEEPRESRSSGGMDSRNPANQRMNKNNEQTTLGNKITPQDHEKAALIMQVLQLTDEQIGMLPPDQRQSILILKEQIAKSSIL